jgi:hypothetical protein
MRNYSLEKVVHGGSVNRIDGIDDDSPARESDVSCADEPIAVLLPSVTSQVRH